MARRKRLGPALAAPETGAEREAPAAPEVKSALRPPGDGAFGAVPPIARVAAESAAEAALGELSEAMARARAEGRLVLRLTLDEIEAEHLVRDRIGLDEEELAGLMASIAEHGQRSPVEVSELGPGRYGLISGWRRLTALRRLAQGGDPRFGQVLALVRRPDTAADAYIAMVEENEIRAGLSYYERARIAARAVEQGVFPSEREALRRLFAHASRARRSKIGSFVTLYHRLDGVLRFPAAIPERLGLALEKRLQEADPALSETFFEGLRRDPAGDAAGEQARLAAFVAGAPVSRAKHSDASAGGDDEAALKPAPEPQSGTEIRPGIFLVEQGGAGQPELVLSGPGVDAAFRRRLEAWLVDVP